LISNLKEHYYLRTFDENYTFAPNIHIESEFTMNIVLNGFMAISVVSLFAGCGSSLPNRDIVGEVFPKVKGKSLDGVEKILPSAFKGNKVILILGYEQNTQFDIDRWGIGFFTADLQLPPVYEIPTIPGLLPSLFKESIDSGMRSGIPKESWKDVITVYGGDGSILTKWTGTESARNCRVILLDENGKVLWMHDKGYGLPPLKSLVDILKASGIK
jgi:hypothetical protein